MGKFDYSIPVAINMPKAALKTDDVRVLRKKVAHAMDTSLEKGMEAVKTNIIIALDNSMNSMWSWNRDPVWRNGVRPGNPRDIVYTGKLRESKTLSIKYAKTMATMTIAYKTPYAALMYYGGYVQPYGNKSAATVLVPGRPWVEAILNGTHGQPQFELVRIFSNAWDAEFRRSVR